VEVSIEMQQLAEKELQSVAMNFLSLVDLPELPGRGDISIPSTIEELGVWGLKYLL